MQWGGLQSTSVTKSLRKSLADRSISHSEVIDILRSVLSDGMISSRELADLSIILTNSRTLSRRSKTLIQTFVMEIRHAIGGRGPFRLARPGQMRAADIICRFLRRSSKGAFPNLDRDQVGIGLLMRVANPGILQQGAASLCGPAALLFNVASDRPASYARFSINLFELGRARLGRLTIEPGYDTRNYAPPADKIHPADWLTMASIRDSENWFFDYDSVEKETAGITLPGELAGWFRRCGYRDIKQDTSIIFSKTGSKTFDETNRLFENNYRICLFIGANMTDSSKKSSSTLTADHWVVLRSKIEEQGDKVAMKIFTWGKGDYEIPHGGVLTKEDFLKNFYGYVAAKP